MRHCSTRYPIYRSTRRSRNWAYYSELGVTHKPFAPVDRAILRPMSYSVHLFCTAWSLQRRRYKQVNWNASNLTESELNFTEMNNALLYSCWCIVELTDLTVYYPLLNYKTRLSMASWVADRPESNFWIMNFLKNQRKKINVIYNC